jgi:hypothetical protein
MLKSGSPYLTGADTTAKQSMVDRGLLNSSIALGASEQARINAALPIAQSDAGIYNQAMSNTTAAENTASSTNAQAVNNAQTVTAQLLTSINTTNANAANKALSDNAQAENARALSLIDNNNKIQLSVLQSQNQTLLQTDVNAANAFSQAVSAIANIQTNTAMSPESKTSAIQSQMNMLNQFLKTTAAISSTNQNAISQLNLDQYFNTTVGAGGAVHP